MSKFIDADRLRAEIEKTYKSEIAPWLSGVSATSAIYDYVLPLIDSLESEKPIWLEKEINKFRTIFQDECDPRVINEVANHFAQWGADHTPLPEDTVLFNKGVEEGKRLMMEEAVEGEVMLNPYPTICLDDCKDYDFKDGDKVRIFIAKED